MFKNCLTTPYSQCCFTWVLLSGALMVAGCGQPGATAGPDIPAEVVARDKAPAASVESSLALTTTPAIPVGGQPAQWALEVLNTSTKEPITEFETNHDKLMHLIVVKKDLSWFNHVHPAYDDEGRFTVSAAVPTAGQYRVYADFAPRGAKPQVRFADFKATGQPATDTFRLVADATRNGWIVKNVTSHPEGKPDAPGGAPYQVALMPMPPKFTAGQEATLHFQVRGKDGQLIKDLQPYLGALGHCVVVDGMLKQYLHVHPVPAPQGSSGPDVMFTTTFPTAGRYKIWGQFQHRGKIVTASYVVDVAAGSAPASGAAASGAAGNSPDPAPAAGHEGHNH